MRKELKVKGNQIITGNPNRKPVYKVSKYNLEAASKGKVEYQDADLTLTNYKEPLRPYKDGYGYLGVLTATNDGKYVQCHICGDLFSGLSGHVWSAHGMRSREYKMKFGLALKTALLSEEVREEHRARSKALYWEKSEEEKRKFKELAKEGNIKRNKKRDRTAPMEALELKNKKGTCPDQILQKILDFRDEMGHVPSKKGFIDYCGGQRYVHLIYTVFGSWKEAIEGLGMVPRKGYGEKFIKVKPQDLIDEFIRFKEVHGEYPTWSDFNRGLVRYSYYMCKVKFGSYKETLAAVKEYNE